VDARCGRGWSGRASLRKSQRWSVSLVEAPSNCGKAAAVAKEVMAINYGNTTGHSIEKFLEAPFAGKHPKPISKST
jgi:hypothetical protein